MLKNFPVGDDGRLSMKQVPPEARFWPQREKMKS
jgi:hypothetical protein